MEKQSEYIKSLTGKRVLVLGGTSGIGFGTAELAASEGAAVVVVSSKREKVDRAIARLPKGAEGYTVDLGKEAQIQAFFEQIGAFDHLVVTAGDAVNFKGLSETNVEQAKQFFEVRFWGTFMAVKYGSPHIRSGGSIVLTTGIVGQRPRKGWMLGAAMAGAGEALTRALAVELAPIRVNAVCPGAVRTELWGMMSDEQQTTLAQSIGQSMLVGRVGEPSDLAQAYLYLMREGYSTGQVIVVDGGASLV